MTKSLETLVEDIYGVLSTPTNVHKTATDKLGQSIAQVVSDRLAQAERAPTLRMSNLGVPCERKLWYSVNQSEAREPLSPEARLKFLFGDILEALLLFLAREAGHDVRGEQDTLTINGVVGHRDAVIDGVTVDCKSASTYSFAKFKSGLTSEVDAFGYLDQLRSYVYANSKSNQSVELFGQQDLGQSRKGAFLVVDKTLGKVCLDQHELDVSQVEAMVEHKKAVVGSPEVPARAFFDEPDGKSGNRKLGIACSYCEFKRTCWPNLRTFAYSNGPRYLTHVVKQPEVMEIT